VGVESGTALKITMGGTVLEVGQSHSTHGINLGR